MNSTFYVDSKYVSLLSGRLDRFRITQTHPTLKANFRCPYCGDSQKSKTKARAWLYEHDGAILFNCFNCDEPPKNLRSFLKDQDEVLYNEYTMEVFRETHTQLGSKTPEVKKTPKEKPIVPKTEVSLKKISQLSPDHPAKKYVIQRRIPFDKHYLIRYTDNFSKWINTLIPNKIDTVPKYDRRIVFTIKDSDGNVNGVTGRAIGKSSLKYLTIMFGDFPKVYGMERFDPDKPSYVVEGPLDSLFLPNAVAMVGADLSPSESVLDGSTFIFDNEPRNKHIVKRMERYLNMGRKVCIWPGEVHGTNIIGKDINDLIRMGMSAEAVKHIIDENSENGLSGKLKLAQWRKS